MYILVQIKVKFGMVQYTIGGSTIMNNLALIGRGGWLREPQTRKLGKYPIFGRF